MARHTILQQLTQTVLRAGRRIGFGEALRRSSRFLPWSVRHWLRDRRMNARVRSGEAAGVIPELGILVPEKELKRVFHQALRLLAGQGDRSGPGDYLEFGVYVGGSMGCMHEVLEERGLHEVRLFGFDSFEGLPDDAEMDETARIIPWKAGDMKVSYKVCHAYLTKKGVDWDRTTLVKGFFEDTLTRDLVEQHGIRKAGIIMVDSNLYSSAKMVLEFCAPLIRDHAVLLLDDWSPATLGAAGTGERRAFEEFLEAHPYFTAEELDSYTANAKVFLVSRLTRPAGR